MSIYISFFLMGLAYLLPNTSRPWLSFWQESVTFLGLLIIIISFSFKEKLKYSKNVIAAFLIISTFLLADFILRDNIFVGDYVVGIIYIASFFFAIFVGKNVGREKIYFFYAVIAAGLLSTMIALAQWLGVELNRLYFLEFPPGGRPFANLGQPNHFGTLIGFCIFSCILIFIERKISIQTYIFLSAVLAFGGALSQSRTLAVALYTCFFILYLLSKLNAVKIKKSIYAIPLSLYTFFSLILPWISNVLILRIERNLEAMIEKGTRLSHWMGMLEAIENNSYFGYGWLRSAEAQLLGTNAKGNESIFQYAHNIFIDIALWFGLPALIIILIGIILFSISIIKTIKNQKQIYSFCAFCVFFFHCLLEYPFAYIYLLVPAGMFLGLAISNGNEVFLKNNKLVLLSSTAVGTVAILCFIDYLNILETSTVLRFRYNRIGIHQDSPEIKKPLILDQAHALMIASYVRPSIKEVNINIYEKSVKRYGTQRVMLNAAMAHEIFGDHVAAEELISSICRINSDKICNVTRQQWSEWKYQKL